METNVKQQVKPRDAKVKPKVKPKVRTKVKPTVKPKVKPKVKLNAFSCGSPSPPTSYHAVRGVMDRLLFQMFLNVDIA